MSAPDPETLYRALTADPGRPRTLRRLQYRCPERCQLLDAIDISGTVLLHQKRFKQSDAVNRKRSSDAGRAKNTFDGNNHWKPRTYFIDSSALAYPNDTPTPRLAIDHVGVLPDGNELTLSAIDFHTDWDAGHAEVRVRSDGTRYAV